VEFFNKIKSQFPADQYSEEQWEKDAFQEGAYSVGQYKTLKVGSFDAGLAVAKANIKEAAPHEVPPEVLNEALGASSAEIREFVIRSNTKTWKSTFLHEVGHIMMGHGDELGMAVQLGFVPAATPELEAKLFAHLAMEKLGIDPGPEGYRLNLFLTEGFNIGLLSEETLKEVTERVEPKVDEFIALGQK
jgi:hypothetical protein